MGPILTANNGPTTHLLSIVGGKPTGTIPSKDQKSVPKRASPDVNDAPLSSDEDELLIEPELPERLSLSLSSLEEELVDPFAASEPKGSSRPTKAPPKRGSARKARTKTNGLPLSSPKRPADDMGFKSGNNTEEVFDMMYSSSQNQKRARKMPVYTAAAGKNGRSSQKWRGQGDRDEEGVPDKEERPGFKMPLTDAQIEDKLRAVEEKPSPTRAFKVPNLKTTHQGKQKDQSQSFKVPDLKPTHQGKQQKGQSQSFKIPSLFHSDDDGLSKTTKSQPRRSSRAGLQKDKEFIDPERHLKSVNPIDGFNNPLSRIANDSGPSSSATDFSTPFLDMTLSTDSSPLSSPASSPILEMLEIPPSFQSKPHIVCPCCQKEIVDADPETVLPSGLLSYKQQKRFCTAHKKNTAQLEWKKKGYPDIDWDNLPRRLQSFYPVLEDIMHGKVRSSHREVLQESVRSGKTRNLAGALMNEDLRCVTTGYYGAKGALIFERNILTHLGSQLRRLAASDEIIASRDVPEYIQAVLIPELAILLVKEDMQVDDEGARAIIKESVNLGELLHDEEEDLR